MRRSDQRRAAVFALYQEEVTGRPPAEALDDAKPFTRELVEGVEGPGLSSTPRSPGSLAAGTWIESRRSRRAS